MLESKKYAGEFYFSVCEGVNRRKNIRLFQLPCRKEEGIRQNWRFKNKLIISKAANREK